jgi:hypothetical protein
MPDANFTPEQYQALFGKLVGKELNQIEKENESFDPRGEKAQDIDRLTASLVDGMIESNKADSYDHLIRTDPDLKYIVDILISNRIIIPYMAKYVDVKVGDMKRQIEEIMKATFDVKTDDGTD